MQYESYVVQYNNKSYRLCMKMYLTLTFDLSKLVRLVTKFTLSTLSHNRTSNQKMSTIDTL